MPPTSTAAPTPTRADAVRAPGTRSASRARTGGRRRAAAGAEAAGRAARTGPVGAGPSGAAQPQRADEEGRRRAALPRSASRRATATPASTASTRLICAGVSAGGGCTRSARPESTAAAPRSSSRRSSRTSTSCCGCGWTAASSTTDALRTIGDGLHPVRPRHAPTSPTGRTSSCTGFGSRTCRTSGRPSKASGLSTAEACGDVPRVVLGSPLAGIAADEIIDGTPAIQEIVRRYIGDPQFSNLPRKFKTAISGSPRHDVAHEVHDVAFVGVVHPEHGPGFDLWVGGGLSTNPMIGHRVGAWVPLDDVPEVWAGGGVDLPGLRLPPAAEPGAAEVPGRRLGHREVPRGSRKPVPEAPADRRARPRSRFRALAITSACTRSSDGNYYVGVHPDRGSRVRPAADGHRRPRARRTGRAGSAPPPTRGWCILDIAPERVDSLVAGLAELGLSITPSTFRRNMMACTGIEFCKLAIVETKARGMALVDELERRLGDLDVPLTININGCPNACARTQIADIGLKGMIVTDHDGNSGRGLPGTPRRRTRIWTPGSAGRSAATRSPGTTCPTTSSAWCAASARNASLASGSRNGCSAPRGIAL